MSLEATLATWELSKKQVSHQEKLLLLSLARRAGEDHTCWPSVKRMCEDTGIDRKLLIGYRQSLIEKQLIKYTGEMKGRSGQVPVMKLPYVYEWEQKRNSPRLHDEEDLHAVTSSHSGTGKNSTSSHSGTGTGTGSGTGTSSRSGTLNIKGEVVSRNKSSCRSAPKKAKSENQKRTRQDYREENEAKPHWAANAKVCEPVTEDPIQCIGCRRTTEYCECSSSRKRVCDPEMAKIMSAIALKMSRGKKREAMMNMEDYMNGRFKKMDGGGQAAQQTPD